MKGCKPYKRLCKSKDDKGGQIWCYDATLLCKTGGRCVPERALCNGFWECDDKSDEDNCSKNFNNYYQTCLSLNS